MKSYQLLNRCTTLLLSASMLLSLAACGGGAKATSMHLKRTEGTVAVSDGNGKDVPVLDNLGLYSGYGTSTNAESYAWIDLDDVKLTKMDQESEIAIQKDGKNLEIEVKSGSLFFNITEPLKADETMNIRTSTMLVGIRGTCGWVEDNSGLSRVYLLEGKVECSAGEQTVQVNAGERAELTADGELMVRQFMSEDVSAFVRPEVEDRGELTDGLPTSQFKSQKRYVDESELPSETKELLRQIINAAQAENWDEVRRLAHTTMEMENIAGERIVWEEPEEEEGISGERITSRRRFYSEFGGYRLQIRNSIMEYNFDYSTNDAPDEIVTIEIRPESGQGYYLHGNYGYHTIGAEQWPDGVLHVAIGQCENYNWTGSFKQNVFNDDVGDPILTESYIKEKLWND